VVDLFKKLSIPNINMKKYTPQVEEYLELMVRLKELGKNITVSTLAKELKISKASVSEMTRKLAKEGNVEFERYGEITLTPKGLSTGKRILRKHRIIEKFLTFIGVKRKIHEEACILEHALSDEVEKKIERIACKKNGRHITALSKGMKGRIERIEADQKTTRRLQDMGLTKGTEVILNGNAPLKGPIELSVRGTRLAVGRKLALKIFIK